MTPEEKAEELFGIYLLYTGNQTFAKNCALIAVDEMLGNAGMIWGCNQARDDFRDYWQEVKKELEKL